MSLPFGRVFALAFAGAPILVGFLAGCGTIGDDEPGPKAPHGGSAMVSDDSEAPPLPSGPIGQTGVTDIERVTYGQDGASQADPQDQYADTDPSALTDFHGALDPYGQWVDDPNYGTIWVPNADVVGNDFAPYETAGHWSYGDDYVWVSDYPWGWAPFHYGRWVYATNGWGWIPGRSYAGAWTSWRTGYGPYSGYVGWAPLPPTYYWRGGIAVGIGAVPYAPYAFCRTSGLFAPGFGGMVPGAQVGPIAQHSLPFYGNGASPRSYGGGSVGPVAGGGGNNAFAGRSVAHPETAGPSPQSLHIANNMVTRPPMNNQGLMRATQFSHPSTAVALGAHQPASWAGGAHASGNDLGVHASVTQPSFSRSTSAYGSSYHSGYRPSTHIGGGEGEFGGHSFGSTYHGGPVYSGYHGASTFGGHHGVPGTTSSPYHPPVDSGYRPPSGGGGHFGGHGGGGGRGGGGHR